MQGIATNERTCLPTTPTAIEPGIARPNPMDLTGIRNTGSVLMAIDLAGWLRRVIGGSPRT